VSGASKDGAKGDMGLLNTVGMRRTRLCCDGEQIYRSKILEPASLLLILLLLLDALYDRSGSLPVSLIGILLVLFFLLSAIAYVSTPQRDVAHLEIQR
jgi:hypothetical protein